MLHLTATYNECYSLYLLAEDKEQAVKHILLAFLSQLKHDLAQCRPLTTTQHVGIIIIYHVQWVKLVQALVVAEKRLSLKPEGLLLVLLKLFPRHMQKLRADPELQRILQHHHL